MIKSVQINYPDFKLEVKEEFKKGVNVLEKDNWYWKSVILNTILSMYIAKYPGIGKKQYPNGTAQIIYTEGGEDKQALLVKWNWIGAPSINPLYRWIQVWEFFRSTKSTDEQRSLLIQLLWLDYEAYMASKIKDYYPDMLKDKESELKAANANEKLILADITRLEVLCMPIEAKTFPAIEAYRNTLSLIQDKKNAFNDTVFTINSERNRLNLELTNLKNRLANKQRDIELLRSDYESHNEAKCKTCGQSIWRDEAKLKFIEQEWKLLKLDIEKLEADIAWLEQKLTTVAQADPIYETDPMKLAKQFNIELDIPPEEMFTLEKQYNNMLIEQWAHKKELELKKQQLKNLKHLELQDSIEELKEAKSDFLSLLETKVKDTGLNVELFKVSKEWNVSNTFKIMNHEWVEYAELSTGNKLLLEVEVAMLFVKTLGLDLILIDEAAVIGKNILNDVLDKCAGVQIIMSKPTAWKLKT